MARAKYDESKYINRELSWLEFNQRVLEEAIDKNNPILEAIKFISIVSSNLDEFFMIRVASIFDQVEAGLTKCDLSGLKPDEQLNLVLQRAHLMVIQQYKYLKRYLVPQLYKHGVKIVSLENINDTHLKFIEEYYSNMIFPVLTPMVVDKSRPFPLILNKSLNIALLLEKHENLEENMFATIQVPSVLSRFVELPDEDENEKTFILLEDIIKMNLASLFEGHNIIDYGVYRVTRNADQGLDEEGAEDLLEAIEQFVKMRRWGTVVRLEIQKDMCDELKNLLVEEFEVPEWGVFPIDGPIDLTFLMKFARIKGYNNLRYEHFEGKMNSSNADMISDNEEVNMFEIISKEDKLLHLPYEKFDPVVELVKQAANDKDVLAIKQTLYRVSGNSPIVEALALAAEKGKQVTVLVELKARFDEENNIQWAKKLEISGCHVIYGLVGLKTHCKLLLIVRREDTGIKRYVHMGTGNYNDDTAKLYTDIGFFTSSPYFGADASVVFNMLSGYSKITRLYKCFIAPYNMRTKFIELINSEIKNKKSGEKAKIIAKINSLVDKQIIDALYEASRAGVEIELIVRGMCCLRPDIPGLSENIVVRSIVGRFLEHSRIFYFYNGGSELLYLSSADWMDRNFDRRVELMFPIEEPQIKDKIMEIFDVYLNDTAKSRIMKNNGSYAKSKRKNSEKNNCQEIFMKGN